MNPTPNPGSAAVRRALKDSDLNPADATARPRVQLSGIVLDAIDPRVLARFYGDLLGWEIETITGEWARLVPPDGSLPGLSFQADPSHRRPSWPAGPDDVQMQVHLDIVVDDLAGACARAEELGAVAAEQQPQPDVRVYLDPEGHPFCLFLPRA